MTSVVDELNQKVNKLQDKLAETQLKLDAIIEKIDEANKRLVDLQLVSNVIEREIKNKRKSSKLEKHLAKLKFEEPIKVDEVKFQKGSFDEWVYQTQLPKIKQDIEEINQLRRESIKLKEKMKDKSLITESSEEENE